MATRSAAAKRLPPCQYGATCYRKNPAHFTEFSHPRNVFDMLGPTHPAAANATQSVADYLFGTGVPAPAPASAASSAKKRRSDDDDDEEDEEDEEKDEDDEDEDEDMDGSSKRKKKADSKKRVKGKKAADEEEEKVEDETDDEFLKSNGLNVDPASIEDEDPNVAVLGLKKRYGRVVELTGLRVLIRYKQKYYIVCNRDFGEYGPDDRPNGNWCVRPLPAHIEDDDSAVRHSLLPRYGFAEKKCPKQWLNPIKKFIQGKGLKPKAGEWIDHMDGALPSQREKLPNLYDLQGYADSDIDTSACLNLSNCSGDTAFEMKHEMAEEWQKALEEEAKTDSGFDLSHMKQLLDDEENDGNHKFYDRVYEDAIQSRKFAAVQMRLAENSREIEVPLMDILENEIYLPRVLAKLVTAYALPVGPTADDLRATRLKMWRDKILPSLKS